MKNRLLCSALIIIVLLTSSCGKNTTNGKPNAGNLSGKLSISVCSDSYNLDVAIKKFNEFYPDVEIVLNKYNNDYQKYKQQVSAQLMSGTADDLLDATGLLNLELTDSGLLADFLPLMENDPTYNPDDYYTNVFDGLLYNNKLYQFPTSFFYSFIGVNNKFSPELTEKFKQYDSISYREVLDLYNGLEDKGGRYVSFDIDAVTALLDNFSTLVDFENEKCYFNTPYFIDLITDAKNGTSKERKDKKDFGNTMGAQYNPSELEEYASKYLFLNASNKDYRAFFPVDEQETFTHFIPLVDENRRAIMNPAKRFYISEASENKELAWAFVKFLTTPEANEGGYLGGFIPGVPVNRELFKNYVTDNIKKSGLPDWINSGGIIKGEQEKVIERVVAVYYKYNEIPMKYQNIIIGYDDIFLEPLKSFYDGVMTAEQVASELQNKISLYLME